MTNFIEQISNSFKVGNDEVTLNGETISTVLTKLFNNYNNVDKYKIINNNNVLQKFNELKKITGDMVAIEKNMFNNPYYKNLKDSWKKMLMSLSKLQLLLFIKKIKKNNCDQVIKTIVDTVDKKIEAMNNILEETLKINEETEAGEGAAGTAGTQTAAPPTTAVATPTTAVAGQQATAPAQQSRQKYLKYKNKYLALKKKY